MTCELCGHDIVRGQSWMRSNSGDNQSHTACVEGHDMRALEAERRAPPQTFGDTTQGPTRTYSEWVKERSCASKDGAYGHQLDARAAILDIAQRGGPDMTEYKCPYCPCWHLTRKVEEAS